MYFVVIGHLDSGDPASWSGDAKSPEAAVENFVSGMYAGSGEIGEARDASGNPLNSDAVMAHWRAGGTMSEIELTDIYIDMVFESDTEIRGLDAMAFPGGIS